MDPDVINEHKGLWVGLLYHSADDHQLMRAQGLCSIQKKGILGLKKILAPALRNCLFFPNNGVHLGLRQRHEGILWARKHHS
jgi:hypothetical protein